MLRAIWFVSFVVCAAWLGGCGTFMDTSVDARSTDGLRTFSLSDPVAIYRRTDLSTADIYITDVPLDRLTKPGRGGETGPGAVVHVNLFMPPRAGRTPVDETACNVTVRMLVLGADGGGAGSAGMYAGGGFAYPKDDVGDERLRATIYGATMRLLRRGDEFRDLLGSTIVDASVKAERDDARAAAVGEWFERMVGQLPMAGAAENAAR